MPVQFGPFTLDAAQRHLRREGEVVHLTPKAFELLLLLVNQAPRVIGKRELHERLWPTTFVSDATLVGLVKELRRALHDHDDHAPVIRTVHRVGYAFCPEVQAADARTRARVWHWLVCRGRRTVLSEGENIIGRDPGSDVWLDVAGVSRRHARIIVADHEALVEDLGSKNGTMVRDERVRETVALQDGASITFGPVAGVYRTSTAGMSTETHSRSAVRQRATTVE
jgi:DNA-binding winged helix-turn-helix (wHTH) protein